MRAIVTFGVLLAVGFAGLHFTLRPRAGMAALEPRSRVADVTSAPEHPVLRSRARTGRLEGAAAEGERVEVEPRSFEVTMEKKYDGWSALRMLTQGQVLEHRVVDSLRESDRPTKPAQVLVAAGLSGSVAERRARPARSSWVPDEQTEPEAYAFHREALWLLEQGTLDLRREAAEWERGRVARSEPR